MILADISPLTGEVFRGKEYCFLFYAGRRTRVSTLGNKNAHDDNQ